jgi:ArsR family transcriptional regulator, arsenate/arsenite/antimonite-responsive transcriptional repressor
VRDFVKLMKAVADPTRVKILKALQSRSMCVCQVYTALNLAQPTVSKHLKILEDAEIMRLLKSLPGYPGRRSARSDGGLPK